jgi:hypothetical protein
MPNSPAADGPAPTPWIIVCGEGIKVTVQIPDGLPNRNGDELRREAARLLLSGVIEPAKIVALLGAK